MNCVSIGVFPLGNEATIRRVIEYFYPNESESRIWVDIFVDNPTDSEVVLEVLHAGSLGGQNVTDDSWVNGGGQRDMCAAVLTRRIRELHKDYYPIALDRNNRAVVLDGAEYKAWTGSLGNVIGGENEPDAPFTIWTVGQLAPRARAVLRLRLDIPEMESRRRGRSRSSFLAYGEAIVLANVKDRVGSCVGPDARKYADELAKFSRAHKVPEAFEYLIVAPDGAELLWDAVALSALISPKLIHSDALAKTTRWFATDSPYIDSWRLEGNQKADFTLQLDQRSSLVESVP